MKTEELRLRAKFLAESRQALADQLRRLDEEFQIEVLRVRDEVALARRLRSEELVPPDEVWREAKDEREAISERARQRLAKIAGEESEALKELTCQAALHPLKGKRLRELLAGIEGIEQRIRGVDGEMLQLEKLMRQGANRQP